jgi:alcohol dehydrogenase
MEGNGLKIKFDLPTSWRHGRGSAATVGDILTGLGCTRALLLTDNLLLEHKIAQPVLNSLDQAEIDYEVCGEVTTEPTLNMFESLVTILDLKSFDSIVAVGGGSVIDMAKGLAVVASFGGKITDYAGFNKVPGVPAQKIVAIPTTSGTGSEISDGVVLIDEARDTKFLVISKKICPTVALTDPELTCSMPPRVTACSGVDALVHATESYISRGANLTTELFALKAVEMLMAGFKPCLSDGNNLKARESMQIGATMAMIAGMNSYLGLCHALAMPLCALYHMPHGQACGMVLPTVLQYNAAVQNERIVRVLKTMGLIDATAGVDATDARAYDGLKIFLAEIGISLHLSDFGYKARDMATIVQATLKSAQTPTNPRTPFEQDIADIISRVI